MKRFAVFENTVDRGLASIFPRISDSACQKGRTGGSYYKTNFGLRIMVGPGRYAMSGTFEGIFQMSLFKNAVIFLPQN